MSSYEPRSREAFFWHPKWKKRLILLVEPSL